MSGARSWRTPEADVRPQPPDEAIFCRLFNCFGEFLGTCGFPPPDFHTTTSKAPDYRRGRRHRKRVTQSSNTHSTRDSIGMKETNNVIQAGTTFDHFAATSNLTHYWQASNLMIARRSSPISSLVPAAQSAQGTATGPRRNLAHWYQCCPMPSQFPWQPQVCAARFPQLLPPGKVSVLRNWSIVLRESVQYVCPLGVHLGH